VALLLLVAFPLLACIVATLLARPAREHPWFAGRRDEMLVIAHQGGEGIWPSNTMLAYQNAMDLGVDVLEMDIHATSDGALVAMHDETVDRTTDGAGQIRQMTLAQIQALDAGYYWTDDDGATYPFRGQGVTVPSLDEIFTAFPDVPMIIELKQVQPSIVDSFCSLIRQYGKQEQIIAASFDAPTLRAFRRACPEVATSAGENEVRFFYILNRAYLPFLYSPPAEALHVPESSGNLLVVTERFVTAAHDRNMDVHVWTVNEAEDMERLIAMDVDGIMTDRPDTLLELLGR
jgi:glycerophosphoryl diester phosphodiesterase